MFMKVHYVNGIALWNNATLMELHDVNAVAIHYVTLMELHYVTVIMYICRV